MPQKFDPASRAEQAVRELGEQIGYGRMMQLAGDLWNEQVPGGAISLGPCRAFMVPCPCPRWEQDANGHCNVCCGSRQVTERVRDILSEMVRVKKLAQELYDAHRDLASAHDWFIDPELRERAGNAGIDVGRHW